MSKLSTEERKFANDFLDFVNGGITQFHATEQAKLRLQSNGYTEIFEKDNNSFAGVKAGGRYFFTRNQSTIFAFAVGNQWKPGNGFCIQAAHTDSPVFKVKPISKITKGNMLGVGVECYGGGLWNTWFDRDLSVAGRVIVDNKDNTFLSKLVRVNKPILRIPNLAIHLNREIYDKGFKPNKEDHCVPVIASAIKQALSDTGEQPPSAKKQKTEAADSKQDSQDHHQVLLQLLAAELGVHAQQIHDFELSVYDTQPSALGGAYDEFVNSGRLDNLCMSYVCLRALIDSSVDLSQESQIRMVALFDNEEIGSSSTMGAASNMMSSVLTRLNGAETLDAAVRSSLLVSCDMAHALHPNYPEKHEGRHRPEMHKGLVLKQNANQRYATSSVSAFHLKVLADRHCIPLQKFVVRNDVGCGSTIGPILACNTGIRTVDVGVPQLAMHSCREMCGTADLLSSYQLMAALFKEFKSIDDSLVGAD
eukprot:CAMPEP_0175139328 /NCGR_PEP_ID=MMETSP0087-20121206/10841_1 /TAXON_ID=136419 /ORGANISM="Unknown Unknown, Strain D1" /LENGTH=476 /DNA_ID=CAMNT_0016422325 /DNA_START=42 /DNA_END=1472 /DNA_ORIENTATION=-